LEVEAHAQQKRGGVGADIPNNMDFMQTMQTIKGKDVSHQKLSCFTVLQQSA
jgi:hypothetical protein